jgi:hypothetical protein
MSNNKKGNSLSFRSDKEEWDTVLSNLHLFDKILDALKKIPNDLRSNILKWLRENNYYYDELEGVGKGMTTPVDGISEDLETRITKLETVFAYLRERNGLEGCGSSKGE